jgi:ribosomal protein S8E
VRGGNFKFRALHLDTGNFSWGSEAVTRKAHVLVVVYNSSNNELVRTQTLVKNAIVQVDAAPFRQWYSQHCGLDIGKKKKAALKEGFWGLRDCRGGQEGQQESAKEDCEKAGWSSCTHIFRNSLLVEGCLPAFHLNLANVVGLMDIFWRVMSLNSPEKRFRRRAKEQLPSYGILFDVHLLKRNWIFLGTELHIWTQIIATFPS